MQSEIDTGPLAGRLATAGVRILLPVVVAPDAPLVFREAVGALAPDAAGILAPAAAAQAGEPDLLIVPLLAFDDRGNRLGYGGGFYDRTLSALRAHRTVFAVGLAFAGQEVDAVPHDDRDQKLDAIVTEIGYRRFSHKDR
jgi:5-formyltetrahydrofolate cyclo-ligase